MDFIKALETQQYLRATILRTTLGGWICDINGSEVFLPGSQLYDDIKDYNMYINHSVKVVVQKINRKGPVVSHKDYIRKQEERKRIISMLSAGQELFGLVTGENDKGYLINSLGIIAFMPKRFVFPSTYNIGQEVKINVIKSDASRDSLIVKPSVDISDSIISETHIIGNRSYAQVIEQIQDGFKVKLDDKTVGFLSYDEIPQKYNINIGDNIEVSIIRRNGENKALIVSIKQLLKNLQKEFAASLKKGETICLGKVVYIEKDLVTLHTYYDKQQFTIYVKKEDLAWERVQNCMDSVFLGEELKVRFKGQEDGKLYFELKYQQRDLYPVEIFEYDTLELLNTLGFDDNRFIGKVTLLIKPHDSSTTDEDNISGALISNLFAAGSNDPNQLLIDKYTGGQIQAFLPRKYAYGLKDGCYYQFYLQVSDSVKRKEEHRPFMFMASIDKAAIAANPWKEVVEKSFKENKTPKSNRESASLLKEIGADMYTNRDRMFYELLQNADDSASCRGVKVMVQIKDNYLIFVHDGLPFSRQDFRSIVSTAYSTKKLDRKKTGYKGIGFKSVFTDSERVYIKTGGFFFEFNKTAEIFNDFRAFYRLVNPLLTEEQLTTFFEENAEYEQEFEKVDHLPWQLLPFWVDRIPDELAETAFSRHYNVAIALDLGIKAEKYKELIRGIIQKPRFMLFLRNTLRIQFEDKKWHILSIAKQREQNSGVVRLKNSFADQDSEVLYIVRDGKDIPVSNDEFKRCGIAMQKICKVVSNREKWELYQIIDGQQLLVTSIPERIIASDTTTISYAFILDENQEVMPIDDKTPSLYAYLPMEDRRYLLPFFINADFELSSNRQSAKQESLWNEFLFYNIGVNLISWIAELAKEKKRNYLNLLPKDYFQEELEESKIDKLASQFNRGYREALGKMPFILNDKGTIACQADIVIDDTGFAAIIGTEDFCSIMNLQKRLPSIDIDASVLSNNNLFNEIEHIQSSDIVDFILNKDNRLKLLRYWISISASKRHSILVHISTMPKNKKNLFEYIKDIPAFSCEGQLLSFNKLLSSQKVLLVTPKLEPIATILKELGLILVDGKTDEHPFFELLSEEIEAYNLHVFDIVNSLTSQKDCSISTSDKVNLFAHFINSKYGLKQEQLAGWRLFRNQRGEIKPLSQMTHIDSGLYCDITEPFVIDEKEYSCGRKWIEHYLMKEKDQFDEIIVNSWDIIINEVVSSENHACALYKLISTTYEVAKHEGVNKNSYSFFQNKDFVFANGQLCNINSIIISSSISNNAEVRDIVELISGKYIPSEAVIKALEHEPFKYVREHLEDLNLIENTSLTLSQVSSLLSFCMSQNESIFKKYYLSTDSDSFIISSLNGDDVVAYTDNDAFKLFIESHCPSIKFLSSKLKEYKGVQHILQGEELQLFVLDKIGNISPLLDIALPFYMNAISVVRKSLLEHVTEIRLDCDSFTKENDVNLQLLIAASSIEGMESDFADKLRKKIRVVCNNSTYQLTEIRLQHSVEVEDYIFPISLLLPNEDEVAVLVETLKERLEQHVRKDFVNQLFGNQVDHNRAKSIFDELNKSTVVLSNATQVGFILQYAKYNNLSNIHCNVLDSKNEPQSLDSEWFVGDYSFVDDAYLLSLSYTEIEKYMSFPFILTQNQVQVKSSLDNYQHLKSKLSENEGKSLLNYLLQEFGQVKLPTVEDISKIKVSLGLSQPFYVISPDYALMEEKLPTILDNWRVEQDEMHRTRFLNRLFGILDETSDAILVRQYLSNGEIPLLAGNSYGLSELTCRWIDNKSLILDDSQFAFLKDILSDEDFAVEVNTKQLEIYKQNSHKYLSFSDYHIYLYPEQIAHSAYLKTSGKVFHNYKEGDIVLMNDSCIFINEEHLDNIQELIQSLINQGGFTSDDFVAFLDAYKSKFTGSLEGEIDFDPDSDKKEAANELARKEAINWLKAKQYDTSYITTEYSLIKGVRKNGIEYHIVVKSLRDKKKELKINPNEWLFLLNENSRLMLYLGHMTFAVIDRELLLGNHDFLRLRIATSNFNIDGNLNEVITKLARDTQFFERTHFVFEHVHDNILSKANSLDDYNFYTANVKEDFTAGQTSDIE